MTRSRVASWKPSSSPTDPTRHPRRPAVDKGGPGEHLVASCKLIVIFVCDKQVPYDCGDPMAISLENATQLSTELVRVMKLFQSLRHHTPKLHPGVEPAFYPILFNLVDEPRRVSLLADCIHSDVSTVSRQVTMLVSHGLVDKVADAQDGRAFMVSLSAEGAERD